MRSTTAFLAAATALLSFAAATPLERRYQECRAPQQWHICGDGWSGCCSVSPCKGPALASGCPDQAEEGSPRPESTDDSSSSKTSGAAPVTPSAPAVDVDWKTKCKEDDSNCNWKPTYYSIKNYDEEFSKNTTDQLYAWKDKDGPIAYRRDAIAVFENIPKGVKNCTLSWYKPENGIFYGTAGDGSFNLSIIDTGNKKFEDAVDGSINWKNTKKFFANEDQTRVLDLGNWGWETEAAWLNSASSIACSGKSEIVIHFEMSAVSEGSVIVDQVYKKGQVNSFVQRAGWVLRYDPAQV